MTTQVKVLRENVIKALNSVKDDNVSIADIVIDRKKLLAALKLQTQPDADVLTLTYGIASWQQSEKESGKVNEACVQFSCNHTTFRFLNRPKVKYGEPKVIPLNFIDYRAETTKPELAGIPVDTQELIEALNFVIHGVATEESRPVLQCVLFDCSKDTITLVTADGFRLPVTSIRAKGMTKKQALIHRADIPKLQTFLKSNVEGKGKHKNWQDTYIDIQKDKAVFASDKGTAEFDIMGKEYHYPKYEQLIPDKGHHVMVVASDMLQSVKALRTMAKDGSNIIRMEFNRYPSQITLSAKNYDSNSLSSVECPAFVEHACYIAANANYLIDFLKTCKDRVIDLFITEPSRPMVFHDTEKRLEVIMPMFVQW